MSCYYVKPYTASTRWATVLGPGGQIETDFLPTNAIANEIAFQRTLSMSQAHRPRIIQPNAPMILTPAQARQLDRKTDFGPGQLVPYGEGRR